MKQYSGLLFDLDGVIVDTAKYHYLAWKKISEDLGIPFTLEDNERLKGVSRMASFEIILEIGKQTMTESEKEMNCKKKNDLYVSYIQELTVHDILPGVKDFLVEARQRGYKTALGSASKNSVLILKRLDILSLFDVIIDGTKVSKAKPDPEVFLNGARELSLSADECIVFEDAIAGIQAAHNAGMKAIGIGKKDVLLEADVVMPGFQNVTVDEIFRLLIH